ncbi:MAG: 30S ribosome-binding factor RbfA [Gemmatimonadetes bacterium]|nr:30S ribosome-binding factor RbfA [Gemmatimonadota bacterium]
MSKRLARLNEQFRREITELLRQEVRDPRVGTVTVTEVDVTPDLAYARVYISTLGDAAEKEQTLEGLRAAAPYLRGELGRRLRIRRVPELHFEIDRALEQALRIERLLRELRSDRADESGAPAPGQEAG